MRTYRVFAVERVVRYKDFKANSAEEAGDRAEAENPAMWEQVGDYECYLYDVELHEDIIYLENNKGE